MAAQYYPRYEAQIRPFTEWTQAAAGNINIDRSDMLTARTLQGISGNLYDVAHIVANIAASRARLKDVIASTNLLTSLKTLQLDYQSKIETDPDIENHQQYLDETIKQIDEQWQLYRKNFGTDEGYVKAQADYTLWRESFKVSEQNRITKNMRKKALLTANSALIDFYTSDFTPMADENITIAQEVYRQALEAAYDKDIAKIEYENTISQLQQQRQEAYAQHFVQTLAGQLGSWNRALKLLSDPKVAEDLASQFNIPLEQLSANLNRVQNFAAQELENTILDVEKIENQLWTDLANGKLTHDDVDRALAEIPEFHPELVRRKTELLKTFKAAIDNRIAQRLAGKATENDEGTVNSLIQDIINDTFDPKSLARAIADGKLSYQKAVELHNLNSLASQINIQQKNILQRGYKLINALAANNAFDATNSRRNLLLADQARTTLTQLVQDNKNLPPEQLWEKVTNSFFKIIALPDDTSQLDDAQIETAAKYIEEVLGLDIYAGIWQAEKHLKQIGELRQAVINNQVNWDKLIQFQTLPADQKNWKTLKKMGIIKAGQSNIPAAVAPEIMQLAEQLLKELPEQQQEFENEQQ